MRQVRARSGGNLLLRRLPSGERDLLASVAEQVELTPGELLCAAGGKVAHVYFPNWGVVCLFAGVADHAAVGVGMIRADGMFGLDVVAGNTRSRLAAVAQGAGGGARIDATAFRRVIGDCPRLRDALFVHANAVANQMAQNAACHAAHPSLARVARWMLDVAESSPDLHFSATQASIGAALGLQRPAVSHAATELQRAGHIDYRRGRIRVLDAAGLRGVACNCSIPGG